MAKLKKEDCWKILNSKCTIPEVIKMFGGNQTEIDNTIEEIKQADRHDSSNYFALTSIFTKGAYLRLIELKEINNTKIFNLASKKYDDRDARLGDMGVMGEKNYRYANGAWEFMF